MRTDTLVDRLAQNLRPVRPRSIRHEALLLLLLGVVEIGAFLGMEFMRPDMPVAMEAPSFWWKLSSMGLIAFLGSGVALLSADPVRSPRRGLRWILVCIAAIFAAVGPSMRRAVGWRGWSVVLIGPRGCNACGRWWRCQFRPPFSLAACYGAAPQPIVPGTALAAGLSSAAWGAFVFVFACPSDDPLYIAVWYTVGCSIVTLLGGVILVRLARW